MAEKIKATHQDGTEAEGPVDTGNPHAKRPADKKQGDANFDNSANKDPGVTMPSGKVTEAEIAALFGNVEGLSEDFATKAHVLIEGALSERESAIRTALQEEFDGKVEDALQEAVAGYEEKIDSYMNYVVETWMAENALSIEQGIKSDIAEQVLESVAAIVEASGVTLPEDKVDIAESLADELRETESKLNNTIEENLQLKDTVLKFQLNEAFEAVADGLSDASRDKLQKLAEGLSYKDATDYKARVAILKESIGESGQDPARTMAAQLNEEVKVTGGNEKVLTERQKAYLDASRGLNTK